MHLPVSTAATPRTLWIELTSKCPFDCVFCSRSLRRGSGQHLPFPVYQRLIERLVAPRRMVLNYSGESLVYPDLVPAIRLAHGRGAFVELVSAFAIAAREQLRGLSTSGLGRLTVSVHATDPQRYTEIYRHSSFADLESRLTEFVSLGGPTVDLAFVAMERNLDQLAGVTAFAERLGLADVFIFPILRRDPIPETFGLELFPDGVHTVDYRRRLDRAAAAAREQHAGVRVTTCSPLFDSAETPLGEVPRPFPDPLPPGALVHTCEQNPWETAHVLSNGDVVVCEILDKVPMGNLFEQSIEEIWNGTRYQEFRRRYRTGEVPECRTCEWKQAYRPGPLRSEILAREGGSAQLLRGWHACCGEEVIWSTQQAAALLRPRPGSQSVHVCGLLPAGPRGSPNELRICCNGVEIGLVENAREYPLTFGLDFHVPAGIPAPWHMEFQVKHVLRPRQAGLGPDDRDLGFALVMLASKRANVAVPVDRLRSAITRVDRLGTWLRGRTSRRFGRIAAPAGEPGVSIVIPERDCIAELTACLESVTAAVMDEPVQVIVVVNGAQPAAYDALRRAFPECQWMFHRRPLGFNEAIRRGLRAARFEWVYLLNDDAAIDPGALRALLPARAPDVFAIGSQILLKDVTRYRDETNWTTLFLENGLVTAHDGIPPTPGISECFYAGGGASLFQKRVLAPLVAASSAYHPFYWEDVEWGWRARKRGYRVLFCAESIVHHARRATIARHYDPEQVDEIVERNRLLFQLRNVTAVGSLERVFDEIAHLPRAYAAYLQSVAVLAGVARVRLWNHLALRPDSELVCA